MKDLLLKLSDEVFKKGKPGDKLLAQCTAAAVADAAGDGWIRFARTMSQAPVASWMRDALLAGKHLPGKIRRHMLVVAAREVVLTGQPTLRYRWFADVGCEQYMTAPASPELVDCLRPQYEFAEFLCCAYAVLKKQKIDVPSTDVMPWHFGLDANAILGMLDATAGDFDKHPVLRAWLSDAKKVPQPAF